MNRKTQIVLMTLCMALLLAWGGTAKAQIPTTGLKLWWDASNINGSNNAGLNNGDRIGFWKDKSGNNNDGTPLGLGATYTASVAGFNNKPAVTFHEDKANEQYNFAASITDVRTVFWAIRDAGGAGHYLLGCNTTWGGGFGWTSGEGNDTIWGVWTMAEIVNGVTRVLGNPVDGTVTPMAPLGHTIISVETTGPAQADFFSGDGRDGYDQRGWKGDLTELIIYNTVLSETDRVAVTDYLKHKYTPLEDLTEDLPLISPAAGQTGVTPEAVQLVWHYHPLPYAGEFRVYLKAGGVPGPGDVVATLGRNQRTLALPPLLPSTTYQWQVEVFQFATSKFSEVRSFTTGAASTPPAIPATGQILHLDPTVGVTVVGAGVTSWADQSGRGNNATQGSVANQPTLVPAALNGKPVLGFDGTQWLDTASGTDFGIGAGDVKVFAVSKNTVAKGYSSVYGNRDANRNGFYEAWSNGAVCPYLRFDAGVISYAVSPVNRLNTWVLAENGRTAGIHKCWDSGVNYYTATFPNILNANPMAIGAWAVGGAAGYNHEGQIAEIIMYNRGLTAQEEFDVRKNLALKYALPTAFDILAPAVTALSPASNADVSKEEDLILRARALPAPGATVSSVEFFVNGASVGTDTTGAGWSEYSMTWAPPAVGAYTIVALATDSNGLMASASVTVNSVEIAPSVGLGTPSPAMSTSGPVDFPTTFTAVESTFALTADKVTLAASTGSVTGTVSIVAGLLPRTPIIRVTGITGFGDLRVCVVAGAGTSPYGLGDTPAAVSPAAGIYPPLGAPPTTPASGSKLWWDASNINGSNNAGLTNGQLITSWKDRSGNNNDGNTQGAGATYTASVAGFNNKPAMAFHADKANEVYYFTNRIDDVRTVFWAIRKGDPGFHWMLGAATDYWGGYAWSPGGDYDDIWSRNANENPEEIRNGVTRVYNEIVNGQATAMTPLGYTIISLVTTGNVTADAFSGDLREESYTLTRNWYGDLAELIIYNRELTAQEFDTTGIYLAAKYGKTTTFGYPQVPTVALVYPTDGAAVLPSDTVALKATATPGAGATIAAVEFYADGELVGTVTSPNALGQYVVSWTAPATVGRVLIFARALDNRTPAAAAGVSAQVYLSVVNPLFATVTGAGTKDGASWATATTLDEAFTAAGAALVTPPIYVKSGTYTRTVPYTFTKGLALYGGFAGTETKAAQRTGTPGVDNVTTLDAGGTVAGIFANGGQSVTLDRLTFSRSANTALVLNGGANTVNNCSFTNNAAVGPGGGIYTEWGTTNVTRSVFKNNTAGDWGGGGIGMNGSADLTVEGCWFEANQANSPTGSAYGGGICAYWGSRFVVTNSVFVANISRGEGGAIELDWFPGGVFNNTFHNNQSTDTGFSCILQNGDGATFVANNIFSTHDGQVVGNNNGVPDNVEVRNNLLFDSTINSGEVIESGSVTGDPLFVNTTTDFSLQAGSPAINKGLTGSLGGYDFPTADYAGLLRFDGQPDLGAYEIAVTGTLTVTPDPLSFGIVAKETTSTKTLTLINTAGNTPIIVSAITLAGDTQFSLVDPPTLPVTLTVGESLDVVVAFTAPVVTTRVPYSGTVTVANTGTVTPAIGSLNAIAAPSLFPGEPPTVKVERSAGTPATTNVFPIEFNITFSEGVTGFELGDINWAAGDVKAGNVTGATLIPREATGAQYTLRITEITGMGAGAWTINPVVPAAVCETIGKYGNEASTINEVVTYTTNLFGAVIATTASDITDAASVTCTVTFNAPVKAVDALALIESKLDLAGTSAGASIASVLEANASTAYTVEITTGGDGTLALTLNDDDSILSAWTDAPLNGAGSSVIQGPMIEVDKTSPTLVSVQRAFNAARGTNDTTVIFEVTFSDIVTGVDADDFAIACSDATADVASVATLGNTALVVCNVKAAVGPYALSVKIDATMTNRVGLGYETATPDPNEDYYILTQAPLTSAGTWTLY